MIETETNYSLDRMNRYIRLWKYVYLLYKFNKENGKGKQNEVGQGIDILLLVPELSGTNYIQGIVALFRIWN